MSGAANGSEGPRNAEALREEIARTRAELSASTQILKESLARELDWREWIRQRPWVWLGLSFAVGCALGSGIRWGPRHGRKLY